MKKAKIFLSHVSEEAPIAQVLKTWIKRAVLDCDIFVSSDIDSLPAGNEWFNAINNALSTTSVFVVLCSPASISRTWINFEAGSAWIKGVPVIPICHSGLSKGELPSPLSHFQALEIGIFTQKVGLSSTVKT